MSQKYVIRPLEVKCRETNQIKTKVFKRPTFGGHKVRIIQSLVCKWHHRKNLFQEFH